MKKIIPLLFLVVGSKLLPAQQAKNYTGSVNVSGYTSSQFKFQSTELQENYLESDSIKWTYIRKYYKKYDVIKANWKQYFKTDVYEALGKSKEMIFPIYFDSYGSVYPNLSLLKGMEESSFETWSNNKDQHKYSLHQFFMNWDFRKKFEENVTATASPEEKVFYNTVLSNYDNWRSNKKADKEFFYKLWDSVRYAGLAKDLQQKVAETGAKKIIFFVHGYNVPYSLAVLQSLELQNYIHSTNYPEKDKVLIVPVFWPSNDAKFCELPSDSTLKGFSIKDKNGIFNGGLRTGTLFWYYSNQAYYAAKGLREILNGIAGVKTEGKDVNVVLFSHSLGANVVTSAIINTFSKMQLNSTVYDYANVDWDSLKVNQDSLTRKLSKNDKLGFEVVKMFKTVKLPKQKITLFLSAPAIAGENTFMDISDSVRNKIKIYSTINKLDPVLQKKNAGVLNEINAINAGNFGSTSFGCNYNDDCAAVQDYFDSYGIGDCLRYKELKINDHDFFVYLSDPDYRLFIYQLLNDTSKTSSTKIVVNKFDLKFKRLVDLTKSRRFDAVEETRFNNRRFDNLISKRNNMINVGTREALKFMVMNLIDEEKENEFSELLLPETLRKIVTKEDPFALVMLRRELIENIDPDKSDHMKRKLIKVVDRRISETCYDAFPMYGYKTQCQQPVKFVSIRSGNDLFTPAGLYATIANKNIKTSHWYFQRNDDRDYTGSLLIEVGTDYLRAPRRRNINTYQTLFYGFDVYTPYFRDYEIFTNNDTFNINDRPHASFQYFGWGKKGLSKWNFYRWSFAIKIGKIGGFNGRDFQAALHQDISYSPRPRGWGAQIANNGRLGYSFEGSNEVDKRLIELSRENHFWNLRLQGVLYWMVGSYMSNASLGIQLSNKSFKINNANFINQRNRQNVIRKSDNLMYALSFAAVAVKHNTMLQGYGVFDTNETKNDSLTPRSRYVLMRNQVRPFIWNGNITISYTTRYVTVFYRWTTFSPETTLDDTKAKRYPTDTETMKIGKRWHHFAVIGICFNVKKY